MAAYVSVSGLISTAMGLGMKEYIATPSNIVSRRGRTRRGSLTKRLNAVKREIVPKSVVAE